ncbi:hypothetical protein GQ55_7G008500 [Panicum hallii var. hallii]|uniref:Uncharacterized protein n=1 Tax=Panicum hallii var. hallii TaxID=1504633 RepID=A0A2T7CRM1_9POAL|nr:hypothetical protein GQ55_7G008500 [Panicum hallii var. hallii]
MKVCVRLLHVQEKYDVLRYRSLCGAVCSYTYYFSFVVSCISMLLKYFTCLYLVASASLQGQLVGCGTLIGHCNGEGGPKQGNLKGKEILVSDGSGGSSSGAGGIMISRTGVWIKLQGPSEYSQSSKLLESTIGIHLVS